MKTKPLNWALNAASFCCIAVVIWQFAHRDRLPSSGFANSVRAGSKLALPDAPWKRAPKTLLLGLSAYCQYCRAGAGFYRTLIKQSESEPFHVVVALRELSEVYKPYLSALGVDRAADIRTVDLSSVGIGATPTLLMVDDGGTVRKAWTGKLTAAQEGDVYASLGVPVPEGEDARVERPRVADDAGLRMASAVEIRDLLARPNMTVVDVRERKPFQEGHIDGALNMPLDEILSRAPHELPKDRNILVYCGLRSACEAQAGREGVIGYCGLVSQVFGWAGFHDERFIADSLSALAASGVHLSGKTCR